MPAYNFASLTPDTGDAEKILLAKQLDALTGSSGASGTLTAILLRERRNLGEFGSLIIADTDTHAGNWCAVQVVADAVFNALTLAGQTGTWTGVTFPAGFIIRGTITSIDLTSGTVIAINAEAQAATLTTSLAGADNDLVFTAVTAGAAGNVITVAYVDPSANDAALSIGVVGNAITVNLATDSGGAITTTSDDIKTALLASTAASALVTAEDAAANDGSGVVTALAATNLAGGAG